MPGSKKQTLEMLNVKDIRVAEGYQYAVESFDRTTGSFTLKALDGFTTGSVVLNVSFYDTQTIVPLTVKVSVKTLTLKLGAKSMTLNKAVEDFAEVKVTPNPADYRITGCEISLTDSKGIVDKTGELNVSYADGKLRIDTDENTDAGAYKLTFRTGGAAASMTVNVTDKAPTVSLKAKGTVDLAFPGSAVTVTPSFKNYTGGSFTLTGYAVTEVKSKKDPGTVVNESFKVVQSGNTIRMECIDDTVSTSSSYILRLKLELINGMEREAAVTLKVKRTNVKLKLSSTKLSLNKTIQDSAAIGVTCTTKGYAFEKPVWQVMDRTGKNPSDGLTVDYRNGKLELAVNENTQYGATYKVLVRANATSSAVTLTVTVPALKSSAIKVSLKAKNSIDVVRGATAVTVTPSYKNSRITGTEELFVYSSADKYAEPVNHLFHIDRNGQGQYILTAAEGLDHSKTYKVQLVTTYAGLEPVKSSLVKITVKMGSAKLTLSTADRTMFAKDRNDRLAFTMTKKDAALNDIREITVKDARYADKLEVIGYGNGEFAVVFKDGKVDPSLVGKTVTVNLNIFLEGNETTKVNTTAKLKITVVK